MSHIWKYYKVYWKFKNDDDVIIVQVSTWPTLVKNLRIKKFVSRKDTGTATTILDEKYRIRGYRQASAIWKKIQQFFYQNISKVIIMNQWKKVGRSYWGGSDPLTLHRWRTTSTPPHQGWTVHVVDGVSDQASCRQGFNSAVSCGALLFNVRNCSYSNNCPIKFKFGDIMGRLLFTNL